MRIEFFNFWNFRPHAEVSSSRSIEETSVSESLSRMLEIFEARTCNGNVPIVGSFNPMGIEFNLCRSIQNLLENIPRVILKSIICEITIPWQKETLLPFPFYVLP